MWTEALRIAPLMVFVIVGGQLSIIDLSSKKLPNRLVAICAAGILILQIAYCIVIGSISDLVQAGITTGKLLAAYVVLYLLSRGQLGMGDVKFAIPVGLVIGWFYPQAWLVSLLATFLLAGIVAVFALVTRKLDRKSSIPLGPFMYLGSILTLFIGLGIAR